MWQTVDEESKRKGTLGAKLQAASKEERIHIWEKHFQNLLGKFFKVTDKPITKINYQRDIKLGQFTQGELDIVLTKIKNRKYHKTYRKQRNSMAYCSDTAMLYIIRT